MPGRKNNKGEESENLLKFDPTRKPKEAITPPDDADPIIPEATPEVLPEPLPELDDQDEHVKDYMHVQRGRVTAYLPNPEAVERFAALVSNSETSIGHLGAIYEHLGWLATWLRLPRDTAQTARSLFLTCLEIIDTDERMRAIDNDAQTFRADVNDLGRWEAHTHYHCLLAAVNLALAGSSEPLPSRPQPSRLLTSDSMMIQEIRAAQVEMPIFQRKVKEWEVLVSFWARGGRG